MRRRYSDIRIKAEKLKKVLEEAGGTVELK